MEYVSKNSMWQHIIAIYAFAILFRARVVIEVLCGVEASSALAMSALPAIARIVGAGRRAVVIRSHVTSSRAPAPLSCCEACRETHPGSTSKIQTMRLGVPRCV